MNKELAARVRDAVQNTTHVPNGLHDLGLSETAVGVYVRWLRQYQHGDTLSLVETMGDEIRNDPSIRNAIVEIRAAGIMPREYDMKASYDAECLARGF